MPRNTEKPRDRDPRRAALGIPQTQDPSQATRSVGGLLAFRAKRINGDRPSQFGSALHLTEFVVLLSCRQTSIGAAGMSAAFRFRLT
jgi:hypothetical protein